MKSSFKTLSRIQKFNIDEQRKILAAHITKESEIEAAILALQKEFSEEKEYSKDKNNNKDFGLYLKRYMQNREALETSLKAVQKQIEEVKDVIAGLFKEQKTFDIVEQHRVEKEVEKENMLEQKMLDEIGTNNYIKINKNQP